MTEVGGERRWTIRVCVRCGKELDGGCACGPDDFPEGEPDAATWKDVEAVPASSLDAALRERDGHEARANEGELRHREYVKRTRAKNAALIEAGQGLAPYAIHNFADPFKKISTEPLLTFVRSTLAQIETSGPSSVENTLDPPDAAPKDSDKRGT